MTVCFRFPVLCIILSMSAAAGISAKPAPAVDCSTVVMSMADCLSYVMVGGRAAKPEGTCCTGLKTVLKTDAQCLCEAFRNSAQVGGTLNMSKTLALPAACRVSDRSATNCSVSTAIGVAPAQSPVAVSPSVVSKAPTAGIGFSRGGSLGLVHGSDNSASTALTVSIEMLVFAPLIAVFYGLY